MARRTYGTERLGALTDGVFAIAMTLLVLELKIPRVTDPDTEREIVQSLIDQGSVFVAWIISFLLAARIWQELHATMSGVERCNTPLIAIDLAVLGACSLIPFASALVGQYDQSPISVMVFSVIMTLNGLLLGGMNWYIARAPELHKPTATAAWFIYKGSYFSISFAIVGAVTIALAFHHPLLGIAGWVAEPVVAALLALFRPAPAQPKQV